MIIIITTIIIIIIVIIIIISIIIIALITSGVVFLRYVKKGLDTKRDTHQHLHRCVYQI